MRHLLTLGFALLAIAAYGAGAKYGAGAWFLIGGAFEIIAATRSRHARQAQR
jgi:hypothetical protein